MPQGLLLATGGARAFSLASCALLRMNVLRGSTSEFEGWLEDVRLKLKGT